MCKIDGHFFKTGELKIIKNKRQGRVCDTEMAGTISRSSGEDSSDNRSSSVSESESQAFGGSEALIPELEDRQSQVYSLEEQIYRAMSVMVNQPAKHCLVKLQKKKTQRIIVTKVKKAAGIPEERIDKFKERCFRLSGYANPKLEIENELQERLVTLKKKLSNIPIRMKKSQSRSGNNVDICKTKQEI